MIRATQDDIEKLSELILEFRNNDDTEIPEDNETREQIRQNLQTYFKNPSNICFLATTDDVIVGYATISVYSCLTDCQDNAYLDELFISKNYRSQGIGGQFMHGIKQWCQENGVAKLKLTTRPDNLKAQKFYENNGAMKKQKINYTFELSDS